MNPTKKEDPTKRKRFTKLVVNEGSVVTRGGCEQANVVMFRHADDEPEKEKPMNAFDRLKQVLGINRMGDMGPPPSTTKEILQQRRLLEDVGRLDDAFWSSLHGILSRTQGTDMIGLLRRAVDEYANEMSSLIGDQDVSRLSPELLERAAPVTEAINSISTILAETQTAELSPAGLASIERTLDALKNKEEKMKPEDILRAVAGLSDEARASLLKDLTGSKEESTDDVSRSAADPVDETPNVDATPNPPAPVADARVEALERTVQSLAENVSALVGKMSQDQDSVEVARIVEKYDGLGQSSEELAATFTALDTKGREALCRTLDAAKNQAAVQKNGVNLFRAEGAHFPSLNAEQGNLEERVSRMADELVAADPTLTLVRARANVWKNHPELRKEYNIAKN